MDKNMTPADSIRTDAYNTYYMRVAERYRLAKWLLLLAFTVFLVFSMIVNRDSLTHENLRYLLRDFNVSTAADGGFSSVVYEEKQNRTFADFKGELVTAGVCEISFYNPAGVRTLHESTPCVSPVLESGGKYLLLYDEGGTSYSVYTTLASVSSGQTEGAIQCAAMSDSGVYAIVSRSQESKYVVTLYSDSFRLIARYYRDTYVTDVALSPDGKQLAILSALSDHSSLCGLLTLCTVGTDSTQDISLGESLPLMASYLRDGTLSVVSDDGVHLYAEDGGEKSAFDFDAMTLVAMDVSDTRTAVLCSTDTLGTSLRAYVFDSTGTVISETVMSEKVSRIFASDGENTAYLCTRNAVWSISTEGSTDSYATYTGNLLSVCEIAETPVFCFPSGAQTAVSDADP